MKIYYRYWLMFYICVINVKGVICSNEVKRWMCLILLFCDYLVSYLVCGFRKVKVIVYFCIVYVMYFIKNYLFYVFDGVWIIV